MSDGDRVNLMAEIARRVIDKGFVNVSGELLGRYFENNADLIEWCKIRYPGLRVEMNGWDVKFS